MRCQQADRNMLISFVKTDESPCRRCENIDRNKEDCAKGCAKLNAFQVAILRYNENNIKDFQIRCSAVARK